MELLLEMLDAERCNAVLPSPYSERLLALHGGGVLRTEDTEIAFRQGALLNIPPNSSCRLEAPGACFGRISLRDFFTTNRTIRYYSPAETELVRKLFSVAIDMEGYAFSRNRAQHVKTLIDSLILETIFELDQRRSTAHPAVKELLDEILASFPDADYQLSTDVQARGYHPAYLGRQFRKETGLTPKAFLIQQRIDLAKELLRKSDQPIADVAAACGFSDPSYFGRQFRQHEGMTPTAYRAWSRQKESSGAPTR